MSRVRGSSGKVNIALSELPNFTALPGENALHNGAISISPSIDYIERAYDDAKYGRFAKEPYIDMIVPSKIDPDMAPPGKHVMSCFVQYAPYDLEGGWTEAKREAFGDAVVDAIAEFAPEALAAEEVLGSVADAMANYGCITLGQSVVVLAPEHPLGRTGAAGTPVAAAVVVAVLVTSWSPVVTRVAG